MKNKTIEDLREVDVRLDFRCIHGLSDRCEG